VENDAGPIATRFAKSKLPCNSLRRILAIRPASDQIFGGGGYKKRDQICDNLKQKIRDLTQP
jgi:hypothetical protein